MNYDLLIDNAIIFAGQQLYYGTEFANVSWSPPDPISLYKLHGSLNWLRCPMCGSLTSTGTQKEATYPRERRMRCARCGGETTPIVIPPTFFKVMGDFHLQQVWHAAEMALLQAERIFFCGYSLPDADMHIRYLLKRTEVNRGSTPKVWIINNHPGKTQEVHDAEKARYKRQFRDSKKVRFTDFSFQDFSSRGMAIMDDHESFVR